MGEGWKGVMGVNRTVGSGEFLIELGLFIRTLFEVSSVEPMPFSALEDIKTKCQTLSLVSSDSIM